MKVIMQYLKIVLCFNIFEERTLKILSDTYELKKYNSYPYIELEYSNKKNSNIIKIIITKWNL